MNLPSLLNNSKDIRIRPVAETAGDITAYRVILTEFLREIRNEYKASVLPIYKAERRYSGDAIAIVNDEQELEEEGFSALDAAAGVAAASALEKYQRLVQHQAKSHAIRLIAAINSATNLSLSSQIIERGAADLLSNAIGRNSALIESLSADIRNRIKQAFYISRDLGESVTKFSARVVGQFKPVLNRVKVISVDQAVKLNSQLTELRSSRLGLNFYRWISRGDDRVRNLHRKLHGIVYKNGESTGAEGGLPPGAPVNCRCVRGIVIPGRRNNSPAVQQTKPVSRPTKEAFEETKPVPVIPDKPANRVVELPIPPVAKRNIETSRKPSYNSEEAYDIDYYKGDGFYNMNRALLDPKSFHPDQIKSAQDYTSRLDKIIGKSKTSKDHVFYRGIRSSDLHENADSLVGKSLRNKTVQSTTYNEGFARHYAGLVGEYSAEKGTSVVLKIRVKKGTAALDPKTVTQANNVEPEILLQANSQYNVVGVTDKGQYKVIEVEYESLQ